MVGRVTYLQGGMLPIPSITPNNLQQPSTPLSDGAHGSFVVLSGQARRSQSR